MLGYYLLCSFTYQTLVFLKLKKASFTRLFLKIFRNILFYFSATTEPKPQFYFFFNIYIVPTQQDRQFLFIEILCERPRSLGRGGVARQPDVKVVLVLASSLVSYLELILVIAIAITPLNKLTMLV